MKQAASLLFLLREGEILLGMKKRGFGAGRWNGVGGKPEPGESIEQTAVRECQEEIGVTPSSLQHVASLKFILHESSAVSELYVEAYVAREWKGEPTETEEMAPKWFKLRDIPYKDMWADDIFWLPEVLAGKFVTATFYFDQNDQVIKQQIKTK
ncbi:MAG TPA: 8-oxo-dGTP diphosphatase [Candidatus Saccharimonadales bacterium]|nr:8-oxo-dGTP diphosphatase [Candidatus Saccharimonadales bacterium]